MSKSMVQVKFTIDSQVVAAFKSRCAAQKVSMASVISGYMEISLPAKQIDLRTVTRPQRKKSAAQIIKLLSELLAMEEQYRDAIPEQFVSRYETAEQTCEQLTQAISCLEEAY